MSIDCDDVRLQGRYTKTPISHPLGRRPFYCGRHPPRAPNAPRADLLIDPTTVSAARLRRLLTGHLALGTHGMRVFVTAPGYYQVGRAGPTCYSTCDLWEILTTSITCAGRSGHNSEVTARRQRDAEFTRSFRRLPRSWSRCRRITKPPVKSFLTIAIGGTGVRHRSVFVTERLSARWREAGWQTGLAHPDLHPGAVGAPLAAGAGDAATD